MAQPGPKFRGHPLKKALSFLLIRVHMSRGISSQFIELVDVLLNSLVALLQGQKLTQLNLHTTCRNMVSLESCSELCPRDSMSGRLHSKASLPPIGGRASELMSGKDSLLLFSTY